MKSFEAHVCGKWILAGEHSVLRGVPALVYPLNSRHFSLQFQPEVGRSLGLECGGERGPEFEHLVWEVLSRAEKITGHSIAQIQGKLKISSGIPIGAGLGASAALCVAVAKWFVDLGFLRETEIYNFSRELENIFHGESSGVDIAIAMAGKPLQFRKVNNTADFSTLQMNWNPQLYISYSGKRGITLQCVNKVKEFIRHNPKRGEAVDSEMAESVSLALRALMMGPSDGITILAGAIELAQSCFLRWGLVDEMCHQKIMDLRKAGAQAVKMTGSGDGGFLLSLWNSTPPDSLRGELISCF